MFEVDGFDYISAESVVFVVFYSLISCDPYKKILFSKRAFSVGKIQVYCFNMFSFLAQLSTNLQKMHYFEQFKDHNSGKKEIGQITPFFSSTF